MSDTTLRYHICETDLGWVGLAFSGAGLRATTLPRASQDNAMRELLEMGALEPASQSEIADVPERIRALAAGRYADLSVRVDWSGVSPFRRAVLEECSRIPAGQTMSYGGLAEAIGRPGAARAVGRVMATNPFPLLVPCHRVVASDGTLGGYGGGLALKERILRAEGATWVPQASHRRD